MPDLSGVVSRIAAAGRAAWPDVRLSDEIISRNIIDRVKADPETQLENLHDADLYLAMALAEGDNAALKAFETDMVPQMDIALRRLRLAGGTADEVKQVIRFELLVGDGRKKILDYAGRGELAAWLRVSAR